LLISALLGAVHIDRNPKGIKYCQKIIEVSLLSRLNVSEECSVLFCFVFRVKNSSKEHLRVMISL